MTAVRVVGGSSLDGRPLVVELVVAVVGSDVGCRMATGSLGALLVVDEAVVSLVVDLLPAVLISGISKGVRV